MQTLSDEVLVQRIAAGDSEALATLYDRHAPRLMGLLARLVRDSDVAEDLLQETFLQGWRQADRFDSGRACVLVWLSLIARSRARDYLRRRQPVTYGDACEASHEPCSLERVAAKETQCRAHVAMSQLPAEQRSAIRMSFYEGLTHEQIGACTGLPLGTVKTRIRLGMRRLRDLLVEPEGVSSV